MSRQKSFLQRDVSFLKCVIQKHLGYILTLLLITTSSPTAHAEEEFLSIKNSSASLLISGDNNGVQIQINLPRIGEPAAFSLPNPGRLIVDFSNPGVTWDKVATPKKNRYIKSARIGSHPNKIRFVFDLTSNDLPPFTFKKKSESVVLLLVGSTSKNFENRDSDIRDTVPPEKLVNPEPTTEMYRPGLTPTAPTAPTKTIISSGPQIASEVQTIQEGAPVSVVVGTKTPLSAVVTPIATIPIIPTPTQIPTVLPKSVPTVVPTIAPILTPRSSPTLQVKATLAPTNTAVPTEQPTPTATRTPKPSPTPKLTPTSKATHTPLPSPTFTPTRVEPTVTSTVALDSAGSADDLEDAEHDTAHSIPEAPSATINSLKRIDFVYGENKLPIVELELSQPSGFNLSRASDRAYLLKIQNADAGASFLSLPYYPPHDFSGCNFVVAKKSGTTLEITFGVDRGTTLQAVRRDKSILVSVKASNQTK